MTKGERDFNNFLLTPLDMPMEGKYHMPMIKGMVMKNFKAPENFVEFHSATKVPMEKRKDTVVHFFTPDFLFERVWYHPNKIWSFNGKYSEASKQAKKMAQTKGYSRIKLMT